MDDRSSSTGASSLSLQATQRPATEREVLVPEFVPLALVLQPRGIRVELTQPDVLMGRHSEVDIRLPLPDVSRRHCRFLFTSAGWQIVDLNSLNGVHLNGKRVPHATLRDQDRLRIGSFLFQVELPSRGQQVPPLDSVNRLETENTKPVAPTTDGKRRAS